ncbi:N-acyl-D-amino-acid deacylase family protein [Thalassobaculum salexigens]|uniref:N-acyl-D-amino-acid deacylase family protein n=1 Tax=Thalassobaculum salexigens TaxID=455360 RepID=UPI0004080F5E|nr:D-aminoacylase [Thalassobaculum salexigens]
MAGLERCDLKLSGGEVIDGTGAARMRADVAIVDDRIAAIGDLSSVRAGREIDVTGRIVAPGFVDVHTHDDRALLSKPTMDMKVSQGVTSVVVGNCGISLAPLVMDRRPPPPLDLLGTEEWWKYGTFDAFLTAIDEAPASVNAAFLVGHSTLRVGAMDDVYRAARSDEIKTMRGRLEESLDAGACGLSTGLFYAPSEQAPTEEVIEIARALKTHGGRYVTHMRNEGADVVKSLEETFLIGREAGVPVIVSHHKVHGKDNFGRSKETLALFDRYRKSQKIGLDVYPYHASSTVLKADSIAFSNRVMVTWSVPHPEHKGRDLKDIAEEWGVDVYAAAERLQPAGAIYFSMDEDDVQRILSYPQAMFGSDGLPHDEFPHPRLWGTFPRILGHYSRDLGLFPLEEAVRRMTSLSAEEFGLKDRGEVAEGKFADLCVFDARDIIDSATFEDPMTPAAGIDTVIVNGRIVWAEGRCTGERSGRALRQGQA